VYDGRIKPLPGRDRLSSKGTTVTASTLDANAKAFTMCNNFSESNWTGGSGLHSCSPLGVAVQPDDRGVLKPFKLLYRTDPLGRPYPLLRYESFELVYSALVRMTTSLSLSNRHCCRRHGLYSRCLAQPRCQCNRRRPAPYSSHRGQWRWCLAWCIRSTESSNPTGPKNVW
jgi:hypothetical protein